MYSYAYLIGDLIFLVVWLVLFLIRKDLRKEMLIMSSMSGILFPLNLIYLPDYWYPEHIATPFGLMVGLEDFLFAFAIGGIGAVLYEAILGKTHTFCECRKRNPRELMSIILISLAVLFLLTFAFKLNSMYSSYVSLFIVFSYIVFFRKDLFRQAILSGLFVSALMFVFYQLWIRLYPGIIEHWWKLQNISGILIFETPLEEIIWGFAWGLVGGVIYEFARGISVKSKSSKNI